jgi:hypothetical protein
LLFFSKSGTIGFSQLKGHVVFAYPQIKIINTNDSISGINSNIKNVNTIKKSEDIEGSLDNIAFSDQHSRSVLKFTDFPGSENSNRIKYNSDPSCNSTIKLADIHKYNKADLFDFRIPASLIYFQNIDQDPIRKWASRFISEDTTYYKYSSRLVVKIDSNNFIGARTMRWQFAWQIYSKEYTWMQKLVGGGFGFLNWFGYYFYNKKYQSDYPHNPFLSVLLYSGIIGLFIYLVFIIKVFYYYYYYIKEYPIIFICFHITFFFSFFSAGSPFDPPIMGFFAILPFFIHYIHQKQVEV